ncbi:MAG: DUF1456 family protein [Bacteroidia bacterium]
MQNNDILRRIRYTFDYRDEKMVSIFAHANHETSEEEVKKWLKKEDHNAFVALSDKLLATFLNGLIIERRGKKDGPQPVPEDRLDNNIVFRKLKIALNFKDVDILETLETGGKVISKHELSAFFRKTTQAQYRPCQDQVLRNFLQGLQMKFRDNAE